MMEREDSTARLSDFIHGHLVLAIAVVAALAIFAYFKPKHMFKLVVAVAIMGAIVYVISFAVNLTATGITDTAKFTGRPDISVH